MNADRIAAALVAAALLGDKRAAEKHGVTTRTLRRWRTRAARDVELSAIVREKRDAVERAWAAEIPEALAADLDLIRRTAVETRNRSPEMVRAMAVAVKVISEVAVTWRILEARLARGEQSHGPPLCHRTGA